MEYGGGVEAFSRLLTWRRKQSYMETEPEKIHVTHGLSVHVLKLLEKHTDANIIAKIADFF